MKRILGLMIILLIACNDVCFADTQIVLNEPIQVTYTDDERLFYEECFQNARNYMCDPDRQDPEYLYHNQAEYSNQLSAKKRKWAAEENRLWSLATSNDIPRNQAIMIAYAYLEKFQGVEREEMKKYYADAWYNISDPQRSIWRVSLALATDYRRNENKASYYVYIDSVSGQVLEVEKY